jgi:hypothetical protein
VRHRAFNLIVYQPCDGFIYANFRETSIISAAPLFGSHQRHSESCARLPMARNVVRRLWLIHFNLARGKSIRSDILPIAKVVPSSIRWFMDFVELFRNFVIGCPQLYAFRVVGISCN